MIAGEVHGDPSLRVLVVEDEQRLRDVLTRAIPDMGFVASGAGSAEEAADIMAADPREVVLLDMNLPGMSGLHFSRLIHERWPATAVIILTGYGTLEAARQAIRLQVADFLTKPASLGEIESALERARQQITSRAASDLAAAATLPPAMQEPVPAQEPGPRSLEEIERDYILAALDRHRGNRTETAAELGISIRKLYYRLSEYIRQGYLT